MLEGNNTSQGRDVPVFAQERQEALTLLQEALEDKENFIKYPHGEYLQERPAVPRSRQKLLGSESFSGVLPPDAEGRRFYGQNGAAGGKMQSLPGYYPPPHPDADQLPLGRCNTHLHG